MKNYFCILLVVILTLSCNKKDSLNNDTFESSYNDSIKSKLLDPVAVDSFASPLGFRSIDFYDIELNLRDSPKSYKVYSNVGFGETFIIKNRDTLYLDYEITFNKDNFIQKMENSKGKNEFFYDNNNNLILRRFLYKEKGESSLVDRLSYDNYGNLKSFYRYKINPDSTYSFNQYKEYVYSITKEGIIVTIKGIENWSQMHNFSITKKFDNLKRIVREESTSYSPLQHIETNSIEEYKYVRINNNNYVSESKAYIAGKPDETIIHSYEYNDKGKVLIDKEIVKHPTYNTEFAIKKEYSNNNLKQTITSLNSNNKPDIDMYPAKKNGLQETYDYTYNLQNDLIKEEYTIHSGKKEDFKVTRNDLGYDSKGNWNYKKQLSKYPYIKFENEIEYQSDFLIFAREIDYSKNYEKYNIPKINVKAEKIRIEILKDNIKK